MSNENVRIVCIVVADKDDNFNLIESEVATTNIRGALKAYGFTDNGVTQFFEVLLGNEEPPIGFKVSDA